MFISFQYLTSTKVNQVICARALGFISQSFKRSAVRTFSQDWIQPVPSTTEIRIKSGIICKWGKPVKTVNSINKSTSSNDHSKAKADKKRLANMQLNIKLLMNFKFYVPDEKVQQ